MDHSKTPSFLLLLILYHPLFWDVFMFVRRDNWQVTEDLWPFSCTLSLFFTLKRHCWASCWLLFSPLACSFSGFGNGQSAASIGKAFQCPLMSFCLPGSLHTCKRLQLKLSIIQQLYFPAKFRFRRLFKRLGLGVYTGTHSNQIALIKQQKQREQQADGLLLFGGGFVVGSGNAKKKKNPPTKTDCWPHWNSERQPE